MLLFIELAHHNYHTLHHTLPSVLINVDTGIKLLFVIIMIFFYEHIDNESQILFNAGVAN